MDRIRDCIKERPAVPPRNMMTSRATLPNKNSLRQSELKQNQPSLEPTRPPYAVS